MARKNENENIQLRYTEEMLHLGINLYKKSEIAVDILYHLLKSRKLKAFTAIMLRSDYPDFGAFLRKHKRKTDFLFSIDEEQNVYAILCQETKVDGGVYFMRRLEREMLALDENAMMQVSVVAVESSKYSIRDLLFIVLDNYIKALEGEEGSIIHRTVR